MIASRSASSQLNSRAVIECGYCLLGYLGSGLRPICLRFRYSPIHKPKLNYVLVAVDVCLAKTCPENILIKDVEGMFETNMDVEWWCCGNVIEK